MEIFIIIFIVVNVVKDLIFEYFTIEQKLIKYLIVV